MAFSIQKKKMEQIRNFDCLLQWSGLTMVKMDILGGNSGILPLSG
jgi:hypothetical protein